MVMPKQATEKCSRGLHCPICKNEEGHEENSQQSFNALDRYAKQIRLQKEWEEKNERLNKKYNFDYYYSLEPDSDSDQELDYRYKHKYKTLI